MSTRTVELAANEILIQGRKHTLVPGFISMEWSYREYCYSPRKTDVTVFYKQSAVAFLHKRAKGYAERHGSNQVIYPDLTAVVEAYKNCWAVKHTDDYNREHSIVQWCQLGETVATITVSLTGAEMDKFEQIAKTNGWDIETLATHVVRVLLNGQISLTDPAFFLQ